MGTQPSPMPNRKKSNDMIFRVNSVSGCEDIQTSNPKAPVEYFFASDASAIVEHTDRVIYLEDDDVAAVKDGVLSIHRIRRDEETLQAPAFREVTHLKMEIQQIMKGNFSRYVHTYTWYTWYTFYSIF